MYTKLYWPQGGWAIIKKLQEPYVKLDKKKIAQWFVKGIFICGSRRGFRDSGKNFEFSKFVRVEPLKEVDELIKKELTEHFEVFL